MFDNLFKPGSIAIIGASRDPQKVGYAILNNLVRFGFAGKIYPINPFAREILGLRTYSSLTEVGEGIDLAVISVPALAVPDTLVECGKMSLKTAVIISAEFRSVFARRERATVPGS